MKKLMVTELSESCVGVDLGLHGALGLMGGCLVMPFRALLGTLRRPILLCVIWFFLSSVPSHVHVLPASTPPLRNDSVYCHLSKLTC